MELTFPTDRIVGTLDWAGSWHPDRGPVLATGSITTPDDTDISLDVSPVSGSRPSGGGSWSVMTDAANPVVDLGFLADLPPNGIQRLTLGRTSRSSFAAITHLAPGLRYLYLSFADLGDEVLPYVAELTNLIWLQTFGNRFTDGGVHQLVALTALESLYLEEESLSAAAFAFTTRLPRLKRLGLQDVPLSDAELEALQRQLPGVRVE
jgi:hypothetical protein